MACLRVGIVTNLYPTLKHFEEGTFVKDLSDELEKAGCIAKVIHYRWNFPAMFLETLMRRKLFDVLDAQFIAPAGLLCSLTPAFSPLVVTVHRWDILEFPYRWRTASQWTRFALNRADAIVAVSNHVGDEVAKFANRPEKIHIIPNAVDTNRFRPMPCRASVLSKLGISEEALVLFSIGRLVPIKGYDYLLRALNKTVLGGHNVVLVLAGEGTQHEQLKALAKSIGISDQVHFLGRIEHDDAMLERYYSACDIFALTSLAEGHSVAITEAMACGKPILCSDIPGNTEIVFQGVNGALVSPRDIQGIARAIEIFSDSRRLVAQYGERSRAIAIEKFSWRHRITRLLDLYGSLINRDK
jgi:glycosyltransferase involved in cell wall biosynthesis